MVFPTKIPMTMLTLDQIIKRTSPKRTSHEVNEMGIDQI